MSLNSVSSPPSTGAHARPPSVSSHLYPSACHENIKNPLDPECRTWLALYCRWRAANGHFPSISESPLSYIYIFPNILEPTGGVIGDAEMLPALLVPILW